MTWKSAVYGTLKRFGVSGNSPVPGGGTADDPVSRLRAGDQSASSGPLFGLLVARDMDRGSQGSSFRR